MNDSGAMQEDSLSATGRILALDLGEKRIGLALSDESRILARSFAVLKRGSRLADFEKISRIVDEQVVNLIVVGLPVLLSGQEGAKAAWVRDYAAELAQRLGIDLVFWDESFSTVAAERSLRARGKRGQKQRQWVDAVAAAMILQSYLDAAHDDTSHHEVEPQNGGYEDNHDETS
jgi:putative holliday junction resolvase